MERTEIALISLNNTTSTVAFAVVSLDEAEVGALNVISVQEFQHELFSSPSKGIINAVYFSIYISEWYVII